METELNKSPRHLTILITGVVLIAAILGTATTHYRYSDPFYVTEVADRLVSQGRVDLENFEDLDRIHPGQRVNIINEKPFHYYPIGVVISHIPSVLVAKLMGLTPYKNDITLQKYNSMMIIALCWLIFAISVFRFFKEPTLHYFALLIFLTSPIIGSLGSAHWNTTPALLIYFLVLHLTLDIVYKNQATRGRLIFLGFLLGSTLVVRPTCIAASVPIGILLLKNNKKALLPVIWATILTTCLWLSLTKVLYGAFIPSYFSAHDIHNFDAAPLTAFAGILFSPARGFFVFAPLYLLVTIGFYVASKKSMSPKDRMIGLALLGWILIHWLGVVAFAVKGGAWWGGWCFGPRLLAETLPMWFFVACITQKYFNLKKSILLRWAILVTIIWGAFLNIIQSQYNPYSSYWNESISQKRYPQVFWDWEYPQWLNDAQRHNERLDKYGITHF